MFFLGPLATQSLLCILPSPLQHTLSYNSHCPLPVSRVTITPTAQHPKIALFIEALQAPCFRATKASFFSNYIRYKLNPTKASFPSGSLRRWASMRHSSAPAGDMFIFWAVLLLVQGDSGCAGCGFRVRGVRVYGFRVWAWALKGLLGV